MNVVVGVILTFYIVSQTELTLSNIRRFDTVSSIKRRAKIGVYTLVHIKGFLVYLMPFAKILDAYMFYTQYKEFSGNMISFIEFRIRGEFNDWK